MKRLTMALVPIAGCATNPVSEEPLEADDTEEPEAAVNGCLVITSDGSASAAYDYDFSGRLIRFDDGDQIIEYSWSADGLEVRFPFGSYQAKRTYDPELGYPFALLEVKESVTPGFSHRLETHFTYQDRLLLERREDEAWPGEETLERATFAYGGGSELLSQRHETAAGRATSYYRYDPSGRLESVETYRDQQPIDTWSFVFDDDGKPIRLESAVGAEPVELAYEGKHCGDAVASWPAGVPESRPAAHPHPIVR